MAGLESIAPVIQGLSAVSGIVNAVNGYGEQKSQQDQALKELQQKQQEELRATQEDAALEREKIKLEADTAEKERQSALKRATARQRAQYGSSGIDTNSSSSAQAVLLGLYDESEQDRQEREALDNLRYKALDSEIAQQKRLNVLQQTQLRERNKINSASSSVSLGSSLFGNGLDIWSAIDSLDTK